MRQSTAHLPRCLVVVPKMILLSMILPEREVERPESSAATRLLHPIKELRLYVIMRKMKFGIYGHKE